jgi:hypothetical protein
MNMQNATLNGTGTPDTAQDSWHPQTTTTSAPLPYRDALIMIPRWLNLKGEKKMSRKGKRAGYNIQNDYRWSIEKC